MRLSTRLYSISPAVATLIIAGMLASGVFVMKSPDVQVVVIDAKMTDALIVDNGDAGIGDPGDRLRYTTVIRNTGNTHATGVVFTDSPEATSTLVPGSVQTTPIALHDAYSSIGNVGISVPAGSGVLANDSDADGTGFASPPITAFDGTSAQGGTVSLNTTNGSFTYTPPAGFQGADTFTYAIDDGEGNSDVATVSIFVSDVIWFIDNSAAGSNDGRLNSPFTTLAAFQGALAPGAGDCIFLHDGSGSYTGGVTLEDNQTLIGDGASGALQDLCGITLPTYSATLPTLSGTKPTILNTGGNGITLATGNTVRGLSVGNTSGVGVSGASFGTFIASAISVTGTGQGVGLSSGTLAATFESISSSGAANGIVLNNTSGSFTVTGDGATGTKGGNDTGGIIQGTGSAIVLTNATNVTLRNIKVSSAGTHGIHASSVTNFTLGDAKIFNAGDANEEHGIKLENLSGDNLVTYSQIDAFEETGIEVMSNTGAFDLTISNSDFENNKDKTFGEEAILVETSGTASAVVLIDGCLFDEIESQHVQAIALGTSSIHLTVENSTFQDTDAGDAVIIVNPDGSASVNTTINDNEFVPTRVAPFGILLKNDSSGRLDATIQGNTFGNPTWGVQPLSLNHDDVGSGAANGLTYVLFGGTGSGEGNTSTNTPACCTGVSVIATENPSGGDPHDPDVHLSILNNTLTGPTNGFPFTGIVDVNVFDQAQLNLDIAGNTATGPSEDFGGPSISVGYAGGGTFRVEGLAPSPGRANTFIAGQNTITAYVEDGSLTGYTAGNADLPTATTRPNPVLAPTLVAAELDDMIHAASKVTESAGPSVLERNQSVAGPMGITAPAINIGTLPPGKSVTITIDYDLTNVTPPEGCNQGDVSGSNFATVLTDDPDVGGAADPTCTPVANPLPVELVRFEARPDGSHVVLEWGTASEENNAGFAIEGRSQRSEGKRFWSQVAFVEGSGTTNSPQSYSYRTPNLEPGTWNFRLKQVDYDGAFEYSQVVAVEIEVPHELTLSENYPNPFNPATKISFTVPADGHAAVKVYSALGREIRTLFDGEARAGALYDLSLDAASLATGEYLYVLEHAGRRVARRMVLVR